MRRSRRSFLQNAIAISATLTAGRITSAAEESQSGSPKEPAAVSKVGYKRIATEEAWAPSDLLATYRKMAGSKSIDDPGFVALWARLGANAQLVARLADIGEGRIRDMDATGIEMQVLALTSPGVQVFDAATANNIASDTNDQVAEAIRKYPTRFAGLAAAAPQEPKAAAKEIERGVRKLGLKGVIINSHTRGEFLDDPKFWDIFESRRGVECPHLSAPAGTPTGDDRTLGGAGFGGGYLGIRGRERFTCARCHTRRRVRPLPQTSAGPGARGRSAPLLALSD